MKLIEVGMRDLDKLFDLAPANKVLIAALPHHAAYIEKHGLPVYHCLIEELEDKILAELKKILAGEESDDSDVSEIIKKLDEYRDSIDHGSVPQGLKQS